MQSDEPLEGWFFWSSTAVEARARLEFCMENRFPLAVLTGPAGVGKSALVAEFARRASRDGHDVFVLDATTDPAGLSKPLATVMRSPGTLEEELEARRLSRRPVMVVLDHVDPSGGEWVRLAERISRRHHATLVLVGRDDLRESIWLRGRPALRVELDPLTESGVRRFVEEFTSTDFENPFFDDEALRVIDEVTGGVPRDLCLLLQVCEATFGGGARRTVDARSVLDLAAELGLERPVFEVPSTLDAI